MKDGILNINKPQNMTSFDVVAILRKKLGVKRLGHMGTLDPMATGVLPVAIGNATRIMEYLAMDMKAYETKVELGLRTKTDDIWGETIEEKDASHIRKEDVDNVLHKFMGVINQTPPIYSALKVDGKKLYEYAREEKQIEIKSRKVYIESITLDDLNVIKNGKTSASLTIKCSKGTYIRSIARDLGSELMVGGSMSELVRTKNGMFNLADAVDLNELTEMNDDSIEKLMVPMDEVLDFFPKVILGEWESRLFMNGVILRENQWENHEKSKAQKFPLELPEVYHKGYRVYDGGNNFLGIGIKEERSLKPHKVFNYNTGY